MADSRRLYYDFQTEARGLLDGATLAGTFSRLALGYGKRLAPYLPADRNVACLDVPCGYGNFLYFLRAQGYRNVRGFDLDAKQVALARFLKLPAEAADVFDVLADTSRSFGLIASLDFIEHVSRDEALRFLNLCHDRLNPGGVLILRTPSADGPFGAHDRYNDLTHQWGATANVLRAILQLIGFERIRILDERPQAYSAVGALRAAAFYPARALASAACVALGLSPPEIWSRSMWGVAYKRTQTARMG